MRHIIKMAASLCVSFSVCGVQAMDAELGIETGVDSNPLKLSDQYSPKSMSYVDIDLGLDHDFNRHFEMSLGLKQLAYEEDEADRSRYSIAARAKHRGKWFGKKTRHSYELKAVDYDKTYVSRSSGETPIYSGEAVEDRYDYRSLQFKQKNRIKINKRNKADIAFSIMQKSYEDYQSVGLSNLDYDQYELEGGWQHIMNKRHKLDFGLSFARREYDDRRNLDLNGASIDGTDREYDIVTLDVSHNYRYLKHFKSEFGVKVQQRRDNGEGYNDSDRMVVSLDTDYRIGDNGSIHADVSYTDLDYPNQNVDLALPDAEEEEAATKDGYEVSVGYDHIFKLANKQQLSLNIEQVFQDYDSKNVFYRYDRQITQLGLSWEY